jgi:Domain of unknown function (DUF6896)
MIKDLVQRYVCDARQVYQACVESLRVSDTPGLSALLRAARNGQIERKGQVTTRDGASYTYRVHGLGYSFNELNEGKVIHFDIILIDGVDHLRFSAWKLHQYASSVGERISEEALTSGLRELSAQESSIVRVLDGPHEYYYDSGGNPEETCTWQAGAGNDILPGAKRGT